MKAIVNNSTCRIVSREKLTRGTVGKTMEAEFSDDWAGLAITATFEAGDIKKDWIYTEDPITIPHEVLATAGVSVMLGFHGALEDGTIVKRTEKEWLNNVSETLDPAGAESSEPTPDWTAQVQNIATAAKEVADSVRNDADTGKFNGKAGEAGGWYTPAVTQPDANTMRMSFTPSKEGMPAVEPTDITLPGGTVEVDDTLTKSGKAADAKVVGNRLSSLSDEKVTLPKDDDGNVNPGSVGWYAVSDGEGGITWDDSAPGSGGGSGEDGGYYAPSVDDNGNLTWTASKSDMPAVDGANIKGPTGDTGATGEAGPAGADGKDGADGADGADGKSAYEYAVEGGYTGTEEEFAAKLAAEKFANPNALTFTGAVTGSYDGSEALTVEIPSSSGESGAAETCVYSKETLAEGTIAAGTAKYTFTDTGLSWADLLKQWKVFYVEIYSAEKNQFNITGYTNNTLPIFIGKNNSFYCTAAFRSEGKSTNAVTFWRYFSTSTGAFWDAYSPGGTFIEPGNTQYVNQVFNVAGFGNLYIRNYGAETTVDVQWRVVGLLKWGE